MRRLRNPLRVLLALVCALGVTALWYPAPAEAIGFVVNRTDLQAWLKAHPDVKPGVVKVTTIREWLKAHPNVDPKNRPAFKPDEVVPYPTDLTPTLTFKKPANFRSASVLLIAMDPKEGIVWEANDITGASVQVPAGKLKAGRKYFWQTAYILKDGTITDAGTFQFETQK